MRRRADLIELVLRVAREIRAADADDSLIHLLPSQGAVMRFIDRNQGTTPSEVAAGTGLRRSNVSPILRQLEALGMVERRPVGRDGRAVQLYSTPLAVSNLAAVRAQWAERVDAALGADGFADVDTAVDVLRALEAGLIRHRSTGPERA